jgi:hypothetical protein
MVKPPWLSRTASSNLQVNEERSLRGWRMQGGGQLLPKAGQQPAHSYLSSYPYLFVRLEGRIHKRNNKLNSKIMSSAMILAVFPSIFQTKYPQEEFCLSKVLLIYFMGDSCPILDDTTWAITN